MQTLIREKGGLGVRGVHQGRGREGWPWRFLVGCSTHTLVCSRDSGEGQRRVLAGEEERERGGRTGK